MKYQPVSGFSLFSQAGRSIRAGAAVATLLAAASSFPCGARAQNGVQADARAIAEAYNASGQELFGQLGTRSGNIVLSPYSIGTAMAMALSGARGDTEREMASVLKHRLQRAQIDAANAVVRSVLDGYDRSATAPKPGVPSAKLLTANALMLTKKGHLVAGDYIALLKNKYAAEVFQNAGPDVINDWVKRKTEGKIAKITDKVDPDGAAVLLNAIYFKARWARPFDKRATREDAFNLSPSRKVEVPMMQKTAFYPIARRQGYRAIRLPYEVESISMVVVLPDEPDGLDQVSRSLDAQELAQMIAVLSAQQTRSVELALPRFKIDFSANLKELFQKAGMTLAFNAERADFSGMIAQPSSEIPFAIKQIAHRAVIEVAEESTEAAAVTGMGFALASAAEIPAAKPEPFHVERPFLFYIVDDKTAAILFEGRVVDPR